MSAALRQALVERSRAGGPPTPYAVDPALTFYCPQENLDALDMPVVRELMAWAEQEHEPLADEPAVLLLLPCQKSKPYALSREHRAINGRLLQEGFRPDGRGDWPEELAGTAPPELLSNAPLRGGRLRIDRAVISEPFGLVPYEAMYRWRGRLSPCAQYDDPGLFEHRGLACPWRADSTAVRAPNGSFRWRDGEREAYVEVHNRLAESIARALGRIAPRYRAIVSYVAPLMTHRSFVADRAETRASGLPAARVVAGRRRALVGVNDLQPGLVTVVPGAAELDELRGALGGRIPSKPLATEPALDLLMKALRKADR